MLPLALQQSSHQHLTNGTKESFLATLVALDFTLVSQSVGRSFKLAQLRGLRACFDPKLAYASSKLSIRSFHVGLILKF